MSAALKTNPQKNSRTATLRTLENLGDTIPIGLRGTGDLSNRAKLWYYFCALLAARGYNRIEAPLEAIAHCRWLLSGQAKSVSTARRALSELESKGYITRRLFRPRQVSVIDIHLERFDFYISRHREYTDPPVGTFQHFSIHQSDWNPDDFTMSSGSNNLRSSLDVTTSKNSKKNANKKDERTPKAFSEWLHPLIFTIGVLCYPMGRVKRLNMQRAAELALERKLPPFDYWTAERWQAMSIPYREKIAKELLPELEQYSAGLTDRKPRTSKTEIQERRPLPPIESSPPVNHSAILDPFFLEFAERMKIPISNRKTSPKKPETVDTVDTVTATKQGLSKADYEILYWARENARSKGNVTG